MFSLINQQMQLNNQLSLRKREIMLKENSPLIFPLIIAGSIESLRHFFLDSCVQFPSILMELLNVACE